MHCKISILRMITLSNIKEGYNLNISLSNAKEAIGVLTD